MKTSEEWQKEIPFPKVLDPDGWDRTNFQFSWFEEMITKEEYEKRVSISTCMFKIAEVFRLDQKEKEVLDSFIKNREEYIATHGFLSKWKILTKEEVEQDRCKAYPYIF